ncbi:8-oxo-dGDP phosphatase NUDT18 [Python bivittatus]|uniref:8-oxo-dGDP phosphatase NUDT18 n=1 Tax=Python bivittatus TaxID=176946 RepID=A0A9F2R2N6_PYTBI|nr:8-oxo-dGDP phosphatase NUDT18 [Python bivittatus]
MLLSLGGALKSLQQADAESLQALWWDRETPALPLRSRDILPLMDLALQYQASPRHPPILPVELPCASVCQRFLLVFAGSSDGVWVLLGTAGAPHLPMATSSLDPPKLGSRLLVAMQQLLQKCMAQSKVAVNPQGLLGLQHLGKEPGQNDGICFNVVATIGGSSSPEQGPPALQDPAFTWWKVEDAALKSKILQRLNTSSFIPIQS